MTHFPNQPTATIIQRLSPLTTCQQLKQGAGSTKRSVCNTWSAGYYENEGSSWEKDAGVSGVTGTFYSVHLPPKEFGMHHLQISAIVELQMMILPYLTKLGVYAYTE